MESNWFTRQHDVWWWFKLNGLLRHAIAGGYMGGVSKPPVVMTEYPKSGGTWLSQMLSSATGIPYPRNRLPPLRGESILLHGCYFDTKARGRTVVLWRDGRDIMVSFYYHLMFEKPITSAVYSRKLKKKLAIKDPRNIKENLPGFIEWSYNGGYPGFTWNSFVQQWQNHDLALQTSYELLLKDPVAEVSKLVQGLDGVELDEARVRQAVENYSFERQSSRKPGAEDIKSFIRKGIAGDWKNHFSRESGEIFSHYSADTLIALGYESDNQWVDQCS